MPTDDERQLRHVALDAAQRETRQAQEAHGGSMAPDLVDPNGRVRPDAESEFQGQQADPDRDDSDPLPGVVQAT